MSAKGRARSIRTWTSENMPSHALTQRAKIFQRRSLVAALYLTGQYTESQIQQKLLEDGVPCTDTSVRSDLNCLLEQWRKQSLLDVNEWVEREVAKLDSLESMLINNLRLANVTPVEYADRMLRVAERRAKLLGLDQPTHVALDVKEKNFTTLTDAQLEAIIRGELRHLPPTQLTNGHANGHAPETIEAEVGSI